jgi:hypothetical protein
VPVHAHNRHDGSALKLTPGSVRHEQDRVAVVIQAGVHAGEVRLGQFNELVLVLTGDGLATWTRYVRLHVVAFPLLLFGRLGCCLQLLLIGSHLPKRLGIDDIGDGDVRAALAKLPGRGLPALRCHAVLLAK